MARPAQSVWSRARAAVSFQSREATPWSGPVIRSEIPGNEVGCGRAVIRTLLRHRADRTSYCRLPRSYHPGVLSDDPFGAGEDDEGAEERPMTHSRVTFPGGGKQSDLLDALGLIIQFRDVRGDHVRVGPVEADA